MFSSGRMAFVDLKRIGAYSIGTDISTSLNCFGNTPGEYILEDLGLVVKRSSTYWLYDKDFNCTGYIKENFNDFFESRKELLEPIFLHPDKYIKYKLEDIINNNDIALKEALDYFKGD